VEPKADRRPDSDHEPDLEQVADRIGGHPAGKNRRTVDGQRSEPIDHPVSQILCEGHAGLGRPEADREHEQTREQVVDVVGDAGYENCPPNP
jgi:hypothetical protein